MKGLRVFLYAGALWFANLASMSTAHAIPTLWTDQFDPDDVRLSADAAPAARSIEFTFDIRPGSDGFRPGVDFINFAELTIWLYDDLDLAREAVSFNLDGGGFSPPREVDGLPFFPDIFSFSPVSFLTDGLLTVTVLATRGDFLFDRAFLVAFGERVRVPEPAALAAFGVGLLAMGFAIAKHRVARR